MHVMKQSLTHHMHTSIILRTNKKGAMPRAQMELDYFKFTPHVGTLDNTLEPPPMNAALETLISWHTAHPFG